MAQYEGSLPSDRSSGMPSAKGISGWTVGVTVFASVMLILMGLFHLIQGIAAIADPSYYTLPDNYPLDVGVSTWGWLQFTAGVVVLFAGFFLMTGDKYARGIAYVVVFLSALGSFVSIPYYPVWSLLAIALSVLVLWALATYGRYVGVNS